jgi:hypothetical protein
VGAALKHSRVPYSFFITVSVCVVLVGLIGVGLHSKIFGVRLLFDGHDIGVYFRSSRWIFGEGTLYRDVRSEYPLLPNLVFATWRSLASALNREQLTFEYVWVIAASLIYLYAFFRVAAETSWLATLAWLAPAPMYFALFRFDIYPVAAMLFAMLAIRRAAYIEGAFWIGIAAALKGFALFFGPAFFVFIFYRRGLKAAIYCTGIVLAPMLLSLFATLIFAGWEGTLAPYHKQAGRNFNGQSLYDAFNYLIGSDLKASQISPLPPVMQLASALIAAAMRPRTFQDLVNAFLFAVLGFITFSPFYSPQFVLWVLPLASFSDSRAILISTIGLSWLTYLYFPISYDLVHHREIPFKIIVVAITALRLFLMGLVGMHWYRNSVPILAPAESAQTGTKAATNRTG